MSNEIVAASAKPSKKETRKVIYTKLLTALQDFRSDDIKEKRFEANLKKASRMFAADLKVKKNKKEKNKKKKVKIKKEVLNATNGVV